MGIRALKAKSKPVSKLIYTSHYTKLSKVMAQSGMTYVPVRTSRGAPRFPLPYSLAEAPQELMPPKHLLGTGYDDYRRGYIAHLESIGIEAIRRLLLEMLERHNRPLALLCFCKVDEEGVFCHRHIFAEWWFKHTGEFITELQQPH